MIKEFTLDGCISFEGDMDEDTFMEEFLALIETKGWYYGGYIGEYNDGRSV